MDNLPCVASAVSAPTAIPGFGGSVSVPKRVIFELKVCFKSSFK